MRAVAKKPRALLPAAIVLGTALVTAAAIVTAGQVYIARIRSAQRAVAPRPAVVAAPVAIAARTAPPVVAAPPTPTPIAAPAAPSTVADTATDEPAATTGPRPPRDAVLAARSQLASQVDACVGTAHPNRRVRLNVRYDAATGRALAVRVRGYFGLAAPAPCLTAAARQVALPPFGVGVWEAGYSFPTRGP
jgi:hypothetical protein